MDSCCFIELAVQSIGKHEADRENDLWFLKALLNAAYDEEIEVLTTTLTIAECSHAKQDVSEDVKTLFKKFLTSGRYVFLVQDSVLVAEKARNLRWVHGLTLGGADSIHIASALELKCDEFLTWDKKIHDNAVALNELALAVRFPRDTGCLPDSYRQLLIPQTPATPLLQAGRVEDDKPARSDEPAKDSDEKE
jgi:predicted nucleic acid-binding protein